MSWKHKQFLFFGMLMIFHNIKAREHNAHVYTSHKHIHARTQIEIGKNVTNKKPTAIEDCWQIKYAACHSYNCINDLNMEECDW